MKNLDRIGVPIFSLDQASLGNRKNPLDDLVLENTDSFKNLFRVKSEQIRGTNCPLEINTPLEETRLKQLTETVRFLMSRLLFQEVSDSDEHEPDSTQDQEAFDSYKDSPLKSRLNKKNDGPMQLHHIIDLAAKKNRVDPDLVKAVIKAESNYDPSSISSKGAVGLMQLMPETARELDVQNSFDPYENIMGGTKYLKILLDRYNGDIPLALAAYNWGMGNVEKRLEGMPEETRTYISRVSQYYRDMKSDV